MSHYIKIFDTTLRDGEQAPGFSMNLAEKLRLAHQLEKLGVDVIEAGFPAASPQDFESVKTIAESLAKPEVCGLARALESDIETTWQAIKDAKKPRIHTFLATSPVHMEYKLKKTPDQILAMAIKGVQLAKERCNRVDFSPEDAGRSDFGFLVAVIEAVIEAGADTINIPDTVGYRVPEEFGNLIKKLIGAVKNSDKVIFATHCHNDLGLAVANSLAGVKNGARQIECTLNGCGERAGNAALEEIVMALKVRRDYYGLETGIQTPEIMQSSKLLQQITGQRVQANKAIVGQNAFAHESGIHQHGILSNPETYEIMTPEQVGLGASSIILGKHSGSAALKNKLESIGYELSDEKLKEVFVKFKTLADQKKDLEDSDLDVLMMNESDQLLVWELVDFSVQSGTQQKPQAEITLKNIQTGKTFTEVRSGTGMVDAAFQCIENICGKNGTIENYMIDSVTSGLEAQAVVKLQLRQDHGVVISGKNGDTDIVKASILAYLEIINKMN